MLQGFLGAFALARLSTWGCGAAGGRSARSPSAGATSITSSLGSSSPLPRRSPEQTTRDNGVEAAAAVPFGVGVGLTLDEAALLLDLRDVYWTREGVLSVQVSLGVTATLAASILALRVFRRGEEKGRRRVDLEFRARDFSTGALA